jgi:hypothetical protein
MLIRLIPVVITIACVFVSFGTRICLAQRSVAESGDRPTGKAIFDRIGLAPDEGQPVVKLLPVQDKREVAVCGLANLHVAAEVFLQSFRESMARKSDPAILEIDRFSSTPTLDDLQSLTLEPRDIDDLQTCVAGDCKVKLSAGMMQRFQNEIDWTAANYRSQVTVLYKSILLDYVRAYLRQGDAALIEYNDKPNAVSLADETHSLIGASTFKRNIPSEFMREPKALPGLSVVENAFVWSKIKFGLKPVIAINHILIYKQDHTTDPQILVVSKQIYANHYFDASLAVTAFGNNSNDSSASYLFYENRSRLDGLTGLFGKFKRGVIEDQAVDNLTAFLEKSKASLSARLSNQPQPVSGFNAERNWRRWTSGIIPAGLLVFLISAFIALLTLSKYDLKSLKPISAVSRLASASHPISSESDVKGRGTG